MRKKVFIISVGFFLLLTNLFADTIVLKSGKQIEAQIVQRGSDRVVLDIGGVQVPYFLDEIEKINGESIDFAPKDESIPDNMPEAGMDEGEKVPETIGNSEQTTNSESILGKDQAGLNKKNQQRESDIPIDVNNPQKARNFERLAAVFASIILLLLIPIYIYSSICLQFIAKKTNRPPVWLAWIPIANLFLMCKIAGISYWWLLLILGSFIPVLGFVCAMGLTGFLWYKIAIARNKPGWIGVLAIVPLVNFFIMGYLAFSD
ncbi:MAG: hypothetical protein V2A64_06000 [Candidatus Omnitrophota bacterium]